MATAKGSTWTLGALLLAIWLPVHAQSYGGAQGGAWPPADPWADGAGDADRAPWGARQERRRPERQRGQGWGQDAPEWPPRDPWAGGGGEPEGRWDYGGRDPADYGDPWNGGQRYEPAPVPWQDSGAPYGAEGLPPMPQMGDQSHGGRPWARPRSRRSTREATPGPRQYQQVPGAAPYYPGTAAPPPGYPGGYPGYGGYGPYRGTGSWSGGPSAFDPWGWGSGMPGGWDGPWSWGWPGGW